MFFFHRDFPFVTGMTSDFHDEGEHGNHMSKIHEFGSGYISIGSMVLVYMLTFGVY